MADRPQRPLSATLGILLSRVIVPLWVLGGAMFKLIEKTPSNLPKNLFEFGKDFAPKIGLDLYVYLSIFIAVEFVAVGIMLFVPRLARTTAIFITSVFCLVLLGELLTGNFESCGCFGNIPIPPWAMLIVDGLLLIGLLVFNPYRADHHAPTPRWSMPVAGLWTVGALVLTGAMILPERSASIVLPDPGPVVNGDPEPVDPGIGENGGEAQGNGTIPVNPGPPTPDPVVLPAFYYIDDIDAWVGQRWLDIDLSRYFRKWPADIESGKWYVIFYSRTCDHCQELMQKYFQGALLARTVTLAIPEEKTGFAKDGVLPIKCPQCTLTAELPIGCDWVISPPVVVALEDGKVVCAIEGEEPDDPKCLIWHNR